MEDHMAPAVAISPIAFKGFMLGYLHKTAAGKPPTDPPTPDVGKDPGVSQSKVDKQVEQETGQKMPAPSAPPAGTPYADLGKSLAGLWPGAAGSFWVLSTPSTCPGIRPR